MDCAYVITSSLTVEQLENFRRYRPEALELTDEMTGNVVFSEDIGEGPGSIRDGKATFSRTKTAEGKATITLLLDPEVEDKAGLIREKVGSSLMALEKLEARLLEDARRKIRDGK